MSNEQHILSEDIREEILARSSSASSNGEVARVICDSIIEAGIDWRAVPVDEVKAVLVDAIRASRREATLSFEPLVV